MTKKAYELDAEGSPTGVLIFTFDDGEVIRFDTGTVSEEIRNRAVLHGFSQKLGDSYAAAAKEENPLAWAKEQVREVISQLLAGDWRAARAAGTPRVSDLAQALARVTGNTVEEAHAFVETLDDDQKKAYRAKNKVKAALAQIKSERLAAQAAKLAAQANSATDDGEDITLE